MEHDSSLAASVAKIVSSYVSNHKVEQEKLPELMGDVIRGLTLLPFERETRTAREGLLKPAVPLEASITPDYLKCLECGKQLKSMKRHLRTFHKLSPTQYREKWNLPLDYPIVSSTYTKRRANIAKTFHLGHQNEALFQTPYRGSDIALSTLRSMGDGVICTDIALHVTFMNAPAEKFTGWSAFEATGKTITDILKLRETSSGEEIVPARECLQLGSAFTVEMGTTLLNRNGKIYEVGFSAAPVRTVSGEMIGSVMIINDLSGGHR